MGQVTRGDRYRSCISEPTAPPQCGGQPDSRTTDRPNDRWRISGPQHAQRVRAVADAARRAGRRPRASAVHAPRDPGRSPRDTSSRSRAPRCAAPPRSRTPRSLTSAGRKSGRRYVVEQHPQRHEHARRELPSLRRDLASPGGRTGPRSCSALRRDPAARGTRTRRARGRRMVEAARAGAARHRPW